MHLFKSSCLVKCTQCDSVQMLKWVSKCISKGSVQISATMVKSHMGILLTGSLLWFRHTVECPNGFVLFVPKALLPNPCVIYKLLLSHITASIFLLIGMLYLYLYKLAKLPKSWIYNHSPFFLSIYAVLGSVLNALHVIFCSVFTTVYELSTCFFLYS